MDFFAKVGDKVTELGGAASGQDRRAEHPRQQDRKLFHLLAFPQLSFFRAASPPRFFDISNLTRRGAIFNPRSA